MFQTEPVLALQRLEWLAWPMWFVSELGLTPAYIVLVLAVVYLFDFRKGFFLIQVLSWNGLLTDLLKASFALPRPDAVDSRVLVGGVQPNPVGFEAMGAGGFWEPLPSEVVSHYRRSGEFSYGFPSGHCSSATSTWGTIALLFRVPSVRAVALLMILLMPVSRIYLGRHFVADTLGGVTQGLLVIALGYAAALRGVNGEASVVHWLRRLGAPAWRAARGAYLLAVPLAITLAPGVEIQDGMRLLGVNVGWLLLCARGLPEDGGSNHHRLARFLLAAGTFLLVALLTENLIETVAAGSSVWTASATQFTATAATLWGSTELSLKLGLFPGRLAPDSAG